MRRINNNDFKKHIKTHCSRDNKLNTETLTIDALISSQKIIQQAVEIKEHITYNHRITATKLLLICAELELIYKDLIDIRHEYNL